MRGFVLSLGVYDTRCVCISRLLVASSVRQMSVPVEHVRAFLAAFFFSLSSSGVIRMLPHIQNLLFGSFVCF